MKIVNTPPPKHIYDKARELWGVDFNKGVIFTYGDTIHTKNDLSDELLVHEKTHIKQQLSYPGGPDKWWEKYFKDEQFRLEEELQAYRKQVAWIKARVKGRQQRFEAIKPIARLLSSSMYGNIISFQEALKLLYF